MKKGTKDLQRRYEAYQKTIDFHMMEIQGLFPSCRATLIVREPADIKETGDPVLIYSNDNAEVAITGALRKLIEKKAKKKAKKKTKAKKKNG